jgi:hypothetical protein
VPGRRAVKWCGMAVTAGVLLAMLISLTGTMIWASTNRLWSIQVVDCRLRLWLPLDPAGPLAPERWLSQEGRRKARWWPYWEP